MKKFWLNLIEVVAFIYEIFCVLGMVFSVFVLGIVAFSFNNNSDFAQGFRAGFGSWGKGNTLWLAIAFFVVLFLEALAEFFICRFARGLVRNIKNEIFFANQNLELIRKLLVWVATYTVMTIVLFMMSLNLQPGKDDIQHLAYPTGAQGGLLFLAVIYVIYIVFKYGMQLQEDSDAII